MQSCCDMTAGTADLNGVSGTCGGTDAATCPSIADQVQGFPYYYYHRFLVNYNRAASPDWGPIVTVPTCPDKDKPGRCTDLETLAFNLAQQYCQFAENNPYPSTTA